MFPTEIIHYRLLNQRIAFSSFTKPEEVVAHLGAMQSQDFHMAKWAIALRMQKPTQRKIDSAFNEGKILRTHVLRPTWHFVLPADLQWMLNISAPKVHALNALYYRKFDLNKTVLNRCMKILEKQLANHQYKTRDELNDEFAKAKIDADRLKLAYIMMFAELEGLICSGPRIGKQFTYALMEDRVTGVKTFDQPEALKKLATTYFSTRGPATAKDFSWWSGFNLTESKAAIEMLDNDFEKEFIGKEQFIFTPCTLPDFKSAHSTFLVPDYDEYGISYKDRTIYNHPKWHKSEKLIHPEFYHAVAVDGYFGGNWKKVVKGKSVKTETELFSSLTKKQQKEVANAVDRYEAFFNLPP